MAVRRTRWTPAAIPFGLLILLLGAWAFLVPLIGPYFDFGFFTDDAWVFSARHWELLLLPGIVAFVGGLMLTLPAWGLGWLGGLLATAAGIWFLIGPSFFPVWSGDVEPAQGGELKRALLWIAYFYGTGALVTYFAGYGQGLLSRRTVVEEAPAAEPVEREERIITHE